MVERDSLLAGLGFGAWIGVGLLLLATLACSSAPERACARVIPTPLISGEPTTVSVEISPGPDGLPVGGVARIHHYTKPWRGMGGGLVDDVERNDLVRAERSDGGAVVARMIKRDQIAFAGRSHYDFEIRETPLAPGETLRVHYGNERKKIAAGRKQREFHLEVGIDAEGDGTFDLIPSEPLRILENSASRLRVVGPSQAAAGEPVTFVLFAEDAFGNLCETFQTKLDVSSSANGGRKQITMRALDSEALLDRNEFTWVFDREGVQRLSVRDSTGGLVATSNPVQVTTGGRRNLFWGDLHVHTAVSDGEGELADAYRDAYARGHDFIAITDHGFGRALRGSLRERLTAIAENAQRYTVPGKFIAIPAGETHFLRRTHMNLYFNRSDPEMMERLVRRIEAADTRSLKWKKASSEKFAAVAEKYWSAFDTPEFSRYPLAFPHHTLWMGVKEYTHPERQRLIEIYSFHGSSEVRPFDQSPPRLHGHLPAAARKPGPKYSVREILDEGYRLGIVGGSDDHFGQAGSHALTGIYAEELSLEALLDTLYRRECFAVSGHRTVIDFRAGETPMGSVAEHDAELTLTGQVTADGPIATLEIISGSSVVWTEAAHGVLEADFRWTPPASSSPSYFYLRVLLEDGHTAWSSPIWVKPR